LRAIVSNRCDYEQATKWGAYWTKKLAVDFAVQKGIPVVDLYADLASRSNWFGKIKETDAIFVNGVGHGNAQVYTGQNQQILLCSIYPDDLKLMKDRWGSFLSCEFGKAGQSFVNAGMKGFFGYAETYWFEISAFPNGTAELFFGSHFAFDRYVIDNSSFATAFDVAKAYYNDAITKADPVTARYLIWDRDCMVMYGNVDSGPFYGQEPSEEKQCYWCDYKTDNMTMMLAHVCEKHCYNKPKRPSWCKVFGNLVGCPLPA
jgi:hypothetical protein